LNESCARYCSLLMIHQAFLKKFWMLQKGSEVGGCVSLSSSDTDVCVLSIMMQIVLPLWASWW
jgi:hypothetical protein